MSTQVGPTRLGPHDHVVQFYEDDMALRHGAGSFLVSGITSGASTVVLATAAHRAAFEAELVAAGIDVAAAQAARTYVALDADAVVPQLLDADRADPERFETLVAQLVRLAAEAGRPVCVYGELVALLWASGHVTAAIEVETLWNDLAHELEFSLYCAYPARSVSGDGYTDVLAEVCHLHSDVFSPPEAFGEPAQVIARFGATVDAPRAARGFVATTLRRWRQDALVDDAKLAVTELATNAVLHAGSAFAVALSVRPSGVRLAVRDRSPFPPTQRDAAPTASSGRGVSLVSALAHAWGVELFADGKVVWAELRR